MAKKKVSRKTNGQQMTQDQTAPLGYQKPVELSRESSMEDHDSSEEKLHNLKSLNAILLKQTMEKRQQIESLFQAKDSLEAELTRSGAEKTRLRGELGVSSDENLMLKLEMDLFMGFVEGLVREMGVGVDRLVKEKSDRECEIRDLKREANDLKEIVVRMEMKETCLGEEVGELRSENVRMAKEMKKREELIQRVNKERTKLEKTLEEKTSEIDGLVREKMETEIVKRDQKEKIMELGRELEKLNETVKSLTKEEEGLREQVIGLEKNLDEVMEMAKARKEQINALVNEKSIKESELEGLLVENSSIKKQVEIALLGISEKEKLVDRLLREKNELVERIVTQEAEFGEVKKLAEEQKLVASQLEKDYNDETKKLSCKVSELKDALGLVEVERNNAVKALDEEKRTRMALKEKVVELEKMIEVSGKELEKIKAEKGRLGKEKKELENRSESLRKEKSILQKDIAELKRAMGVMKTELESAGTNAKRGLTMLKTVSSLVCGVENRKGEQKREKGMDSYSVELEAIKKAFRNKESVLEDMKKEVEMMKHSVKDAERKKSFWTIVSSITTLFMVASAAYAATVK